MDFVNSKIWVPVFVSAAITFFLFELVFWKPNFFIWLGPLILFFNVLVFRLIYKKWSFLILPLMFLAAAFLFLPEFTHFPLARHIFIAIIVCIYAAIHISSFCLKEAGINTFQKKLNHFLILLTAFLWFSGFYNLLQSFYLELWWVVSGVVLGVFILTWQSLKEIGIKMIHTFVLALIISEICWGISFLPFGYLTLGALLLIIYYVFWDILRNYLENKLSKGVMVKDILFAGFAVTLLLLSNPWLPL